MAQPTLTLSPNELFFLPEGTPATGPAVRVEIVPKDGESYTVLGRGVKYKEAQGRKDKILFFFKRTEGSGAPIFFIESDLLLSSLDNASQRQIFSQRLSIGLGSRLWICPPEISMRFDAQEEQPRGLVVGSSRGAVLLFDKECIGKQPDFIINSGLDSQLFWYGTADRFNRFCLNLFDDPNSQLHFYLRWQKMSAKERDAVALHLPFGDWGLMERIFTLVLQITIWNFGLQHPQSQGRSQWQFYLTLGSGQEKASLFANRWKKVLFAIFQPKPWKDEPICVERWRSEVHKYDHFVTSSMPTAHEALEASLKLQEFLAPHLPPDEIEALFRTDNL